MKRVMYVQIMGLEYPVEANPGDELYVNRLAQYVEEKMKEVKQESNVVDSYKLAVLAAMNISDELLRLQDQKSGGVHTSDAKTDELLKLLDSTLEKSAS